MVRQPCPPLALQGVTCPLTSREETKQSAARARVAAAGMARGRLARESAARRAKDAKEQGDRNAYMRKLIKNVEQRSDDDITDEAAGRMRL